VTAATPKMATGGQCVAISRALAQHGVTQRRHRIAIVANVTGTPMLKSTKDLTRAQARSALEYFGILNAVGELDALVEQCRPAVTS